MFSLLPLVLHENRKWLDGYLAEIWRPLADLTEGIQGPQTPNQNEVVDQIAPYIEFEEQRIRRNLEILQYTIDALDTVHVVTGSVRMENVSTSFPLNFHKCITKFLYCSTLWSWCTSS